MKTCPAMEDHGDEGHPDPETATAAATGRMTTTATGMTMMMSGSMPPPPPRPPKRPRTTDATAEGSDVNGNGNACSGDYRGTVVDNTACPEFSGGSGSGSGGHGILGQEGAAAALPEQGGTEHRLRHQNLPAADLLDVGGGIGVDVDVGVDVGGCIGGDDDDLMAQTSSSSRDGRQQQRLTGEGDVGTAPSSSSSSSVATTDITDQEAEEGEESGSSPSSSSSAAPSSSSSPAPSSPSSSPSPSYYEIPKTTFADIVGHGHAKLRLDEALLPLALPPEIADSVLTGVRAAPATILLHGPPGCGKTQLARAVAGESSSPLITVGPSDILSKFVGESEKSVRDLFDRARTEARRSDSRCSVLFFDEIDSIGGTRGGMAAGDGGGFGGANGGGGAGAGMSAAGGGDGGGGSRRLLAELLMQLTRNFNGPADDDDDDDDSDEDANDASAYSAVYQQPDANGNANNPRDGAQSNDQRPRAISPLPSTANALDESKSQQQLQPLQAKRRQRKPRIRIIVIAATNRPEDCDPALLRRFAVRVFVGPPTRRDRKRILSKFLADVEHRISPTQLGELASATEGWSGSELESLCREAVMAPVRDCLRAAALLRARARKKEQQSGADSGQDSSKPADHFQVARDALIGGFRSLRPVTVEDFSAAVTFTLGGSGGMAQTQDGPFAFGHMSGGGGQYDSDSSSDEEEEEGE